MERAWRANARCHSTSHSDSSACVIQATTVHAANITIRASFRHVSTVPHVSTRRMALSTAIAPKDSKDICALQYPDVRCHVWTTDRVPCIINFLSYNRQESILNHVFSSPVIRFILDAFVSPDGAVSSVRMLIRAGIIRVQEDRLAHQLYPIIRPNLSATARQDSEVFIFKLFNTILWITMLSFLNRLMDL